MNDLEILKLELSINQIVINSLDSCQISDSPAISCAEALDQLALKIFQNKKAFINMWKQFCVALEKCKDGQTGGSKPTQRMYVASLKSIHKFVSSYGYFRIYKRFIKSKLNQDIKECSEAQMSKVVDFYLCLDFLLQMIANDRYKISLIKFWIYNNQHKEVLSQLQMTPSGLDLPMKERYWEWKEDQEDWDRVNFDKRNQFRYQLPETYNDPSKFEEGFYWRQIRNEPYSYWDEDESPYPHYYNFNNEKHRGLDA